jgi:RNA 2',3'-cyclic 3'-phosphodiesterase
MIGRHRTVDIAGAPRNLQTGTGKLPEQLSFGSALNIRPRHRLFHDIWPDFAATGSLMRLMEQLRQDKIMLGRPVDPDRLHVTLHLLGDFSDQKPPSLAPAVDTAAATIEVQPFDIGFDRVGGTRGQLLLLAFDGSVALRASRQKLSIALIKAGLRGYVDPAFSPHVTLSYDFCISQNGRSTQSAGPSNNSSLSEAYSGIINTSYVAVGRSTTGSLKRPFTGKRNSTHHRWFMGT